MIENEGLCRQLRHFIHAVQVAFEKVLDAPIGRTQVVGQQPVLGAIGHEQVMRHLHELVALLATYGRLPRR